MQGRSGRGVDTPWNFTVPLPRAAQRKLKAYAAENGVELRDIGVEALQLWAAENGVTLPPLDITEPDEEPRAVVVG
jgi:hypothetical protein